MGVTERVYRGWEYGRAPLLGHYPGIIKFLGFEPWPKPVTLPQRLHAERRRRGLSIVRAAELVGVDDSTFWWWEKGRRPHRLSDRAAIATFLGESGSGASSHTTSAAAAEAAASPELGALLRERRAELQLTIDAAAAAVGANSWTWMHWENSHHAPMDRFYPALIRFLGREPWPEPQTLGERLRAERLRKGLSQAQAATLMQASPDAVADWEAGHGPKHRLAKAKVEAFLNGTVRPWRRAARRM